MSKEHLKEGHRKRIHPATCDVQYDADELEFMMAMQRYKEEKHRPFPTLKETLEVLKSLGYVKPVKIQGLRIVEDLAEAS